MGKAVPMLMRQLLKSACLLLISSACQADFLYFIAPPGESSWAVEPSVFECSLRHEIPHYGEAVFYHRAGEDSIFHLDAWHNSMKAGQASLVARAPAWKPHMASIDLGFVPVKEQVRAISLESGQTNRMIAELHRGMSPTFTRRAWYNEAESIQVAVSAANFRPAYEDYQRCEAELLPVNFGQINRSTVLFSSSSMDLSEEAKNLLETIAVYYRADDKVHSFFVEGYSDSFGPEDENRDLSQQRAQMVTDYLIALGIPYEIISMRYHGERYPVANNNTAEGRARNRRVTIRLEREFDPDFL